MTIRIEIQDGCLAGTSKPPLILRPYISTNTWEDVRYEIFVALQPILKLRQGMILTLISFLVLPVFSFIILLLLLETNLLTLMDISYEEEEDQNDDYSGDNSAAKEVAFEYLLVIATCGCLSLTFLCLILGSLIRMYWIDSSVHVQLLDITERLEDGILQHNKNANLAVDVVLVEDSEEEFAVVKWLRQGFLAWSRIDYVLKVQRRSQAAEILRGISTSITEGEEEEESDHSSHYNRLS